MRTLVLTAAWWWGESAAQLGARAAKAGARLKDLAGRQGGRDGREGGGRHCRSGSSSGGARLHLNPSDESKRATVSGAKWRQCSDART